MSSSGEHLFRHSGGNSDLIGGFADFSSPAASASFPSAGGKGTPAWGPAPHPGSVQNSPKHTAVSHLINGCKMLAFCQSLKEAVRKWQ
ncbi:hypothetical protein JZ751_007199 [Albula glossodonta]|uniref:Uncharacterized protein n=1 Tax=Albula glossodonta TaxID=121402 RepID=A0A8T2P4W5_9TELE|nr:hypothetical protein JZ751_007199 [Albula glossodonta]